MERLDRRLSFARRTRRPEDNRRFYPDNSLPGITVTDPKDGNQSFTIHPYNTANPGAGDPVAETPRGYMMRYAQWLINDLGIDGLRIDAARHVPYGVDGDAYNPQDIDVPSLIDRATYRQSRRTNLDGTQRTVFNFQEVFSGDKNLLQQFTRKDINPATPNVVGGNRDVLDFPMWFAMRGNLTSNGLNNNWYNIRFASQDINDDGLANNGSQSIGFRHQSRRRQRPRRRRFHSPRQRRARVDSHSAGQRLRLLQQPRVRSQRQQRILPERRPRRCARRAVWEHRHEAARHSKQLRPREFPGALDRRRKLLEHLRVRAARLDDRRAQLRARHR
jgi:hypothetical protein